MKRAAFLAVVLLGCLLVPRAVQARWDGKEDNKSDAALEALPDKELFNEAFDVCIRRAMIERQASDTPELGGGITADASDYLGVIYQVAGKSHGGVAPSWMLELTAAHTVKKCQGAFRTFLSTQQPQEPQEPRQAREPKKAAARVIKKTVSPRRGDPMEQLPPWLAPQQ